MDETTKSKDGVGNRLHGLVKWRERELEKLKEMTETDSSTSNYCLYRTHRVLST